MSANQPNTENFNDAPHEPLFSDALPPSLTAPDNDADALADSVHDAASHTYAHTFFPNSNSQPDLDLNSSSPHYDDDADDPASRSPPRSFPVNTNASRTVAVHNQQGARMSNDTFPVVSDRVSARAQRVGADLDVRAVDSSDMDAQKASNNTVSKSPVMMFGTLVVIGAVAANVVGFRHSRFAVGKDVHRAWQNYERSSRRRQYEAAAQRVERERQRQQQNRYQQQQRAQWQAEAERMRQEEQQRREQAARVQQQTNADRSARETTRNQYRVWEQQHTSTSSNGRRRTTRTTFEDVRVEMDPNLFEALFGRQGDSSRQRNQRTPFGMPEDVLEELLRAAQQQQQHFQQHQQQRNRNAQSDFEFDAFKFWQHMNNSGAFHQGEPGADSRFAGMGGRNSPFGKVGLSRYYSVLGLKEGATDAEIKTAYRKEAMKWHPDRYRGNNKAEADRKFREVTEAYNALTGK